MNVPTLIAALVLVLNPLVGWAGNAQIIIGPASVPAIDGWGGILLVGLLAGILGRWMVIRNKRR